MNKNFSDLEKKLIHQKYHKSRMIVLILFLVVILTMTIAYSANLSSILHIFGRVNLNVDEGNLEITSVKQSSSTNATHNGYTISVKDGSTVDNYTLVANFDIDYYRSSGSSTMSITYNVVIKNNTFRTQILNSVNNTATFTSGNSTLNYSMSGANTGTTVLKPGESVTVTLVFSLGSSVRNVHYIVDDKFEFEFVANNNNLLDLMSMLNTFDATFNNLDSISRVDVYVINNSEYNITYNFSSENPNFEIVNSDGSQLPDFAIAANTSEVVSIYLKIPQEHIFIQNDQKIKLKLNTTSPLILTYDTGTISASVPTTGAQRILENKKISDDSTIDFTYPSMGSGIYKNSTSGEITYFYRGNVEDNYVSFANYTWRIIRIDKYGTRLILDSVIDETSAWANSNIIDIYDATTEQQVLERAKSVLSYSNSPVKNVLDDWYTNKLSSFSNIIRPSKFCEDFSYQSFISTASGYLTYYFGSYLRIGFDANDYTPEFICDNEHTKTYNIGLISGDEVSFAGGLFNYNYNYDYYLYNPNIKNVWWTISPSYYDTTLNTVGIFVVDGATGNLNDWQNQLTIANSNAIRPVITVDTDRLSGGSGIIGDEYTFS